MTSRSHRKIVARNCRNARAQEKADKRASDERTVRSFLIEQALKQLPERLHDRFFDALSISHNPKADVDNAKAATLKEL